MAGLKARRLRGGWLAPVGMVAVVLMSAGCGDDSSGPVLRDLVITTATTGLDIDPDGYLVIVEELGSRPIGPSGSVTFEGVPDRPYIVELTSVAENCQVAGDNPRTVVPGPDQGLTGRFELSCVSNVGAIEFTTASSGTAVPESYTVVVGGAITEVVDANGVALLDSVPAGEATVELTLPGNCSIQGESLRTLTVPFGDVVSTTFEVECGSNDGALQVVTSTDGQDIDSDGYTVVVDDSITRPVGVNDEVVFSEVAAGERKIELVDVASNCVVSGDNPRTLTVPLDGPTSTTFEVECMADQGALQVVTSTEGGDLDPDGYAVMVDDTLAQSIGGNDEVTFASLASGIRMVELADLTANCLVEGDNPRPVTVSFGDTTSTIFQVKCDPFGDLEVNTSSTGMNLPHGLTVVVNGSSSQPIEPNGTVTFEGLPADEHTVELSNLPSHCEVANGSNPRTIPITGGVGSTTFELECWAWLVFDSDRAGNWDVFIMRHDGADQTNLTNHPGSDRQPVVSPNGTRIAFASTRSGTEHIHVMNRNGTGVVQLTTSGRAREPYWSPDGTKIVYSARTSSSWDIWTMNADGSDQVNLTNHSGNDGRAEWSPDGTKLVFDSERDGSRGIHVMKPDGGELIRLTTGDDWNPTWSPDGARIAFTRFGPNAAEDIWVMDADGSNQVNLTNLPGSMDGEAAWSPDGTTIAFASERHGNLEIYLMDPDGTNLRRLTQNLSWDQWPSWSP
jgi:WD40 repeat protein